MLDSSMARLRFKGIRCFSEPQDAVIRPLTLLVGENSSGKSTFLALCQIASSITEGFDEEIPFNDPPFLLGAYEQIASYGGGRAGPAKSFFVEPGLDSGANDGSIRAEFVSKNGQPSLRAWRLAVKDLVWQLMPNDSPDSVSLLMESAKGRQEVPKVPISGCL